MVATDEQLFPGRKMCYRDMSRECARPSKCGHGGEGGEGGRCVLGDGLRDAGGGDAEGD
jgi:hypothetical protein